MSATGGGQPSGKIANAIDGLGGFDKFKEQFNQAGAKQFGSGWVWLVRTNAGKLRILSTPNQDNPLMDGKGDFPVFGNDVWSTPTHLRYQSERADLSGGVVERVSTGRQSTSASSMLLRGG